MRTRFGPSLSFIVDPRYDGDLHRADMAWALHAASRGLSEQQIRDEILHAPRSFEERAHSAPDKLCGTNREQSAQDGQLDPLSARLRSRDRTMCITNRNG